MTQASQMTDESCNGHDALYWFGQYIAPTGNSIAWEYPHDRDVLEGRNDIRCPLIGCPHLVDCCQVEDSVMLHISIRPLERRYM